MKSLEGDERRVKSAACFINKQNMSRKAELAHCFLLENPLRRKETNLQRYIIVCHFIRRVRNLTEHL
jgi:hypothetical protein